MLIFARTMRAYRFFYHYRKSANGMTVHYRGQCLPCKNVVCRVATETKWNPQQPHLVIQGYAKKVEEFDGTITIE